MKLAVFSGLISIALSSCSADKSITVSVSCDATQQYAKTVTQANQRLIGNWRLTSVSAGFGQGPPIPTQVVEFDPTGQCSITQDGHRFGPFPYATTLAPSFSNRTLIIPQLSVNDSTPSSSPFLRLGRGQLYICDEELVLDYGSAFDGPTHTYRRE